MRKEDRKESRGRGIENKSRRKTAALFPLSTSVLLLIFILPKHASRADTTLAVHDYFSPEPTPPEVAFTNTCLFFRRLLSPVRVVFVSVASSLCLLGNLAVVMRRSVPSVGTEDVGGGGGRAGRARIRSRNVTWMQYLKAAQRQYSLSSLSRPFLSPRLSRRRTPRRTPVIVSTALNRPRGLTLTRDHPLVRRRFPRAPLFPEFRRDVWGISARAGFENDATNKGELECA